MACCSSRKLDAAREDAHPSEARWIDLFLVHCTIQSAATPISGATRQFRQLLPVTTWRSPLDTGRRFGCRPQSRRSMASRILKSQVSNTQLVFCLLRRRRRVQTRRAAARLSFKVKAVKDQVADQVEATLSCSFSSLSGGECGFQGGSAKRSSWSSGRRRRDGWMMHPIIGM